MTRQAHLGNGIAGTDLDAAMPSPPGNPTYSAFLAAWVSHWASARARLAHALMGNRKIERGDNLVSYCLGTVAGYSTELERTMFVGEPSARQRELFNAFLEAQDLGYQACKPGTQCSDVERIVHEFLVERGYADLIKHHNGHGMGLEGHERPFFDLGDHTVLQPGMVFSVEPGLYVPGLGGFRHSDTVVVTEQGVEMLTYYPRDLESLTIPPG